MNNITQHGICARIGVATLALSLIAGPVAAGLAQTVRKFVNINVGMPGNGDTWATAYDDLQSALVVGVDEVWVAEGTYKPDMDTGDETMAFDLPDGIDKVYGGFHGNEDPAMFDLADRNFATDETILSGEIGDPGIKTDNSQHVVTVINPTLDTIVLDGFTVTMGYADGVVFPNKDAAGMYILNWHNVTIANCVFERNHSDRLGGAIYALLGNQAPDTSDLTITNCQFNDNDSRKDGGAVYFLKDPASGGGATTHKLTVTDTMFNRNKTDDFPMSPDADGGAIKIQGADTVTITRCDFNENFADYVGGAISLYAAPNSVTGISTITGCTFTGNGNNVTVLPVIQKTREAGAVFIYNATRTDLINCKFTENETFFGSAAIWAASAGTSTQSWDIEFNMTNCQFFRNKVNIGGTDQGGGAVWMSGERADDPNENNIGTISGTWTNCDFIENQGFKGGGAYLSSTGDVTIDDCRFIANTSFEGGGGLCVSDPQNLRLTGEKVLVCRSKFISNNARNKALMIDDTNKGGAVYNRSHGKTVMVNCIIAGNFAEEFGGGSCNATQGGGDTIFELHNALIVGNQTDTNIVNGLEDDGGGHFNRDGGQSTLINCTLFGNDSGGRFGGVADTNGVSNLDVRNCIAWGNTDADGATDKIDEQVAITGTLGPDDVDNNVIELLGADTRFRSSPGGTEVNTGVDPNVGNTGPASWNACIFDPSTGIVTFDVDNVGIAATGFLFQPDPANSPLQLLIKSVDVNDKKINCYGWWQSIHFTLPVSATIFNYHIASGSSAVDFGDVAYLMQAGDPCDLDNNSQTNDLPLDLDNNVRSQGNPPTPDSGAYEIE